MQQVVVSNQPSLVSVSGTLQTILESVCDLVTVYELVAKVDDNSDLTALLDQNIQDSCSWVSGKTHLHTYTHQLHFIVGTWVFTSQSMIIKTCPNVSTPLQVSSSGE